MPDMNPLVTVICTCYNHQRFLKESLDSVFNQTYQNIQIIVVDDASTDGSRNIIESYLKERSGLTAVFNEVNKGICVSFNKGLALAKGKYIIDLATDDVMERDKIEKQVHFFEKLNDTYAALFTNARHIDEVSKPLDLHFKPGERVPEGNIYKDVIMRFFLPGASIMVRRKVLEELGGYDESLAYEDFDFWVRSSRNYKYAYLNEPLIRHRILRGSLSTKFFKPEERTMLESTYKVCQKALWLNKSKEENAALCRRLQYEIKQAFLMENFDLAKKYFLLIKAAGEKNILSAFLVRLSDLKIRTNRFYSYYLKLRGR
jgi:glycosyltransferase involved in cell wall biosynthesis